jgi:2-amino-4-hydroxy-6-hydroxymethyldihydropteridine diphosphokinase
MTPQRTGIALGSNLGDRTHHLRLAVSALRALHTPGEPFLTSPVYQTQPRFCPPGSPEFLNAVVEMAWSGTPGDLHRETLAIEAALGRTPSGPRNAARVIDIDLLYIGDLTMQSATLELPHPRIAERRFVLEPLSAIRPDLVLPGANQSVSRLLAELVSDEPPLARVNDSLD